MSVTDIKEYKIDYESTDYETLIGIHKATMDWVKHVGALLKDGEPVDSQQMMEAANSLHAYGSTFNKIVLDNYNKPLDKPARDSGVCDDCGC